MLTPFLASICVRCADLSDRNMGSDTKSLEVAENKGKAILFLTETKFPRALLAAFSILLGFI